MVEQIARKSSHVSDADINELLMMAEKLYGKGKLLRAGETPQVPSVSTDLPELDAIIGGGIPMGRIIELFGPESSGKTTLAYQIMGAYARRGMRTLFIDAEGTFNEELAMDIYGSTETSFLRMAPETGEEALDLMFKVIKMGFELIIVDSVPALNPSAILEKLQSEKKGASSSLGVANVARLLSPRIGPLQGAIGEKKITSIIFINQIREDIGVMFGSNMKSPGGHALAHANSLKLRFIRKGYYDDKDKVGIYGQNTLITVMKSKVCKPQGRCELPLVYDRGFVKHEDLDTICSELRVEMGFKPKRKPKTDGEKVIEAFAGYEEESEDEEEVVLV